MNCSLVKQFPKHCVPACLESIAKDSGITSVSQTDIVAKFPNVFPKGVLEDYQKSQGMPDVLRHFGLADDVYQISFEGIEKLAELHNGNEVLLMWTEQSLHCVRVCSCDVNSQVVTVMDPAEDKLQPYNLARLKSVAPRLLFFKRKSTAALASSDAPASARRNL